MLTLGQVKGILDRLVAMLAVWLVAKGYMGYDDVIQYGALVIGVVSVVYGWWVNRNKALVQSAATVLGTVVVTTAELANSSPEKNIVSEETNMIIAR